MKLLSGTVDLHVLQLPRLEFDERPLLDLLDPGELEQCARLVRACDRKRAISAKAFLRLVLSRYLQMPADRIDVRRSRNGRIDPIGTQSAGSIHVSASAAEHVSAVALSTSGPIGVDIEVYSERRFPVAIAPYVLSVREQRDYAQIPERLRSRYLTRAWVAKEALLKQDGTGLGVSPATRDALPRTTADRAGGQADELLKIGSSCLHLVDWQDAVAAVASPKRAVDLRLAVHAGFPAT